MITFITTYYNELSYLEQWYERVMFINERCPDHTDFILVDDGSQNQPAYDYLVKRRQKNIRLFAVTKDIGFNSHGARNLAMKHSRTKWNVFLDIDRRLSDSTMESVVREEAAFKKGETYLFTSTLDGSRSLNDYVVHRDDFWECGGYDEEFTNYHYGDRLFLDCLHSFCKPIHRTDWMMDYTRNARKVVKTKDIPITLYPDDNTLIYPSFWQDETLRESVINYVKQRSLVPLLRKRKPIINFPWIRLL